MPPHQSIRDYFLSLRHSASLTLLRNCHHRQWLSTLRNLEAPCGSASVSWLQLAQNLSFEKHQRSNISKGRDQTCQTTIWWGWTSPVYSSCRWERTQLLTWNSFSFWACSDPSLLQDLYEWEKANTSGEMEHTEQTLTLQPQNGCSQTPQLFNKGFLATQVGGVI